MPIFTKIGRFGIRQISISLNYYHSEITGNHEWYFQNKRLEKKSNSRKLFPISITQVMCHSALLYLSAWESKVETEVGSQVQNQPGLHSEFEASQICMQQYSCSIFHNNIDA